MTLEEAKTLRNLAEANFDKADAAFDKEPNSDTAYKLSQARTKLDRARGEVDELTINSTKSFAQRIEEHKRLVKYCNKVDAILSSTSFIQVEEDLY